MTTIKVRDRETEIRDLINLWLMAPGKSCARCGKSERTGEVCCEEPLMLDNAETLREFTRDITMLRQTRANKHAAMKGKHARMALSFPPGLLKTLEMGMQNMYGEKLFTPEYDVYWFMKKFGKYFSIPEEI